ncbi:unnamed protein product [Coccothraustes coccothraustes]
MAAAAEPCAPAGCSAPWRLGGRTTPPHATTPARGGASGRAESPRVTRQGGGRAGSQSCGESRWKNISKKRTAANQNDITVIDIVIVSKMWN